jgi:hypothetical protein
MVQQNLFLCLVFSALAAIFTIAGKVVILRLARRRKASRQNNDPRQLSLSMPKNDLENSSNSNDDDKSQQQQAKKTKWSRKKWETYWSLTSFVVFQCIANGCIFVAPWFGPVSIYWPAYIASQLLANMLIVGTCLQHERFDKPAQIATLVVVAAVLYITITGPGEPQDEQDIRALVWGNWIAMVWLGLLCLVFVVSFLVMVTFLIGNGRCRREVQQEKPSKKKQQQQQQQQQQDPEEPSTATAPAGFFASSPLILETVLLMVSMTCSTLSATASKAASTLTAPEDASIRSALIALTWIIIICWSLENYLEGRHVRSLGRFLPLMTFGSILLNAATGLIVWGDAHVVGSWAGYATALCLLGMGVYLISDLDFFKAQMEEQQDYQRQLETWQDLFGELEEDLNRARVEQSLSRHQRTIRNSSEHHGLVRGNSDPELGTRGSQMSSHDDSSSVAMSSSISLVGTTMMAAPPPPKSASSFASFSSVAPPKSASSFASLSSVDLSSPQSATRKHYSSSSATVRTLDSLERLSTSIRNFSSPAVSADGASSPSTINKNKSPRRFTVASSVSPVMTASRRRHSQQVLLTATSTMDSTPRTIDMSVRTSRTSPTAYSQSDNMSGHSRDSSIWGSSLDEDEEDISEHGYGFVVGLENEGIDVDVESSSNNGIMLPPPPPPITNTVSLRRHASSSPYRRLGTVKPLTMMLSRATSSAFLVNTLDRSLSSPSPSRARSWDDLEHPRLEEESGEDDDDDDEEEVPLPSLVPKEESSSAVEEESVETIIVVA